MKNKTKIAYIHGWGGSDQSRTGKELQKFLPDFSVLQKSFDLENPSLAVKEVEEFCKNTDIIIANSTGGYIVLYLLSQKKIEKPVIFINPLLDATVLVTIDATEKIVQEYTKLSFSSEKIFPQNLEAVLSTKDELLDVNLAKDFFRKCGVKFLLVEDTHSLFNEKSFQEIVKIVEKIS